MIIVRLSGGLGNQMFQYAFGRALSLRHDVPFKLNIEAYLNATARPFKKSFVVREYQLDPFNITADIAPRREIPWIHRMYGTGKVSLILDAILRRILTWKGKERFYNFDPKSNFFGPNTYLVGDWQSPKYWSGIENILKKDFTLKSVSPRLASLIQEIKSQNSVCVHIRRGDYVGSAFHNVLDEDYYKKALNLINQKKKIECVYIFDRDDLEWCKKNLKFDYPTVYVENDLKLAETLAAMSSCKNFVIANSSFSWWAAWLSESPAKIVIAPKKWFGAKNMDDKDLIPEDWIRL
jgi:hypothetical protein